MKLLIQYHNLLFLRSRDWLYTIFIRKTNLKLDLLNFNIFGNSDYEKMDIFLKQLFKKLFKTINIEKSVKNVKAVCSLIF